MLGAGALGRPGGMVQGVRRKGGFGMGNTGTPMADSCQCMAKPTTIGPGRSGEIMVSETQKDHLKASTTSQPEDKVAD